MTTTLSVPDLIAAFGLQAHPEGGFYKETYRSRGLVPLRPGQSEAEARHFSTGIYYLLAEGAISRLHRLSSDEMWHFYLGDPLVVAELHPDGRVTETLLGQDVMKGQVLQHVVPAGTWFGAFLPPNSRYAFVGCTVAPGFDFRDFVFGNKTDLLVHYPGAAKLIEKLV